MKQIFVFGSNLAGKHYGGAANHAVINHGAIMGQGLGLQGNSYAIPTLGHTFRQLPLSEIANYVTYFLRFARTRPNHIFNVTAIGCGIAGFKPSQIAPMFRLAPGNCNLPDEFVPYLKSEAA